MKKIIITVTDETTYTFDGDKYSKEKATELALDWFSERKPHITIVKEDTEKGHVHCPVNGWDCPYWKENNICSMYPEADPIEECDDFFTFWNVGNNYICYDEHEKEE